VKEIWTKILNFLKKPVFKDFPHSKVWRFLVTLIIASLFLWKSDPIVSIMMPDMMPDKHSTFWAIFSLEVLILYLSIILWFPSHNVWECIEKVDYANIKIRYFREKISGSLNVVSTLVAFSIAFIVLSLNMIIPHLEQFIPLQQRVIKLAMGLLVTGLILLVVTMEAYGTSLNPAFDSKQIEKLYTKGWWLYTFGFYLIVVALLLYVYLLEPLITIIGVTLFIIFFTWYLKTSCNIISY